jgi:sterol desaturase/sphingolipid hydroxylase (fatty acid hydroxylase superfamily)
MVAAEIWWRATLQGYGAWAVIFTVLSAVEILFGRERVTLATRWRGLMFWSLWIPVSAAFTIGLTMLWSALHVPPLLRVDLLGGVGRSGWVAAIVGPVAGILIGDFAAYWYHRAQHAWLWRYHAVHHSIRDMNAVNSYHHVSETLFSMVLMTLPTSLLAIDCGPTVPMIPIVMWFQAVYLHSPARLSIGPLRAVMTDNRYHRIHHSLEERHFDHNFGIFLSIWDRMFGTHHRVAPGEWPDVGLTDMPPPAGVRAWLDLPLRYGRQDATVPEPKFPTPPELA